MFIMRPDSHKRPGGLGANVLELISPLHLRSAWHLVDGNVLEVEVEGDENWWRAPEP
jgi:CTP-dependent riboflavin kinase